jgi:hypothetical protein
VILGYTASDESTVNIYTVISILPLAPLGTQKGRARSETKQHRKVCCCEDWSSLVVRLETTKGRQEARGSGCVFVLKRKGAFWVVDNNKRPPVDRKFRPRVREDSTAKKIVRNSKIAPSRDFEAASAKTSKHTHIPQT